jgi:hypothetical protein
VAARSDTRPGGDSAPLAAADVPWPPAAWRSLFWDVDPAALDRDLHQRYIVERVLELGDLPAVRALFALYSREEIAQVVLASRQLSRRSARFWAVALELQEQPLACTRPSWTARPLIS